MIKGNYMKKKASPVAGEKWKAIGTWGTYALFLVLMALLHREMSLDISDDGIFKEILKEKTLAEHMSTLYFSLNGKVFPDTLAAVFTYLPPVVWKALDAAVLLGIVLCVRKLFAPSAPAALCMVPVLLLDFGLLPSAGYVATSVNYLWTSAAALAALLPLKYADRFPGCPAMYPVCAAAGIYAGNHELSGAIVVTVYTLFLGAALYKKNTVSRYLWFQYFLAILGLVFLFTAPGHVHRESVYNIFCIPDYLALDPLEKLARGVTSTAAVILTGHTVIWPLFCYLLALAVWLRNRQPFIRLLSLVPLASCLVLGNFQRFLPEPAREALSYRASWSFSMPDYRYIDAVSYPSWRAYLPLAAALLVLGLAVLEIFWAFGRGKEGICLFLTFAAGFCTRLAMGFSPTLYGSYYRTFIFLYLALGICIVMLTDRLLRSGDRLKAGLGAAAVCICVAYTYYGSMQGIL